MRRKNNKWRTIVIVLAVLFVGYKIVSYKGDDIKINVFGYTIVYHAGWFRSTSVAVDSVVDTVKKTIESTSTLTPDKQKLNQKNTIDKPTGLVGATEDEMLSWLLSVKGWRETVKTKQNIQSNYEISPEAKEIAQKEEEKNQRQIEDIEAFILWLKESQYEKAYSVAQKISSSGSMSTVSMADEEELRKAISVYKKE